LCLSTLANKIFSPGKYTSPIYRIMPRIYRKRSKVVRRPKRRTTKPRTFAKKVLDVIHRQAENKIAYATTGDAILKFPASCTFGQGLNIFSPLPAIARGTNEGDRIGNTIKPLSLKVKGYLFYKPAAASGNYNSDQSRVAVRMMVLQPKQFSSNTNASSTSWYGQVLQKQNTTVAPTGKISDLMAPINKDVFKVWYDKIYYMSTTEVAQATAVGYYMIENKDATKFFNLDIKLPKTLTYDDSNSSGTQPINCSPQILMTWCYMNGANAGTTQECGIMYDSVLTYEDS